MTTGPTVTMDIGTGFEAVVPKSAGGRVHLARGALVPGTPYRIEEWIAEGGMGAVYRARHEDIDRVVALKVLHESGGGGDAIQQLRREARVTAGIEAPNIVEVYDFLRMPDGRVAMAMEMVDGQTLRSLLEHSATVPPARLIGILRQVCRGLGAAHEAGLVHLDIKPENIMLCRRDGRSDFVKVLDFGIASALGEANHDDLVGTAAYLAPERLGDDALDGRTDFYSLGCVAYEMLVGSTPFSGNTAAVMEHHVKTPPRSASKVNDAVPTGLGKLILRCMAKDPADRPRDAADLEAALCEAQIAAGLRTAWDDLPIPPVEAERRAFLRENMIRPEGAARRAPRRGWWAAAAIGTLVAVAAGMTLRDDVPPAAAQGVQGDIDELATRAYAAAAKTFYFYPPPDEPKNDTAYTVLMDLDVLGAEHPAASQRASTLRTEFADALVRLGDRYWDEPGGRAFSIDYYAQALMFDPERRPASERAMLSVGQVNDLRRKARERAFTGAELRSVEPLLALALDDDEERNEALARLVAESEQSLRVRENLTRIAQGPPDGGAASQPKPPGPEPGASDDEEATERPASDGGDGPTSSPDTETARSLVARARLEARAGRAKKAQTLFNRALMADPKNLAALVGLGDLHFDAGNYTEAARHRRAASRRAPRNGKLRIGLGDALLKTFRYDDAMTQYKHAAKLGHSDAADRIARLEKRMGGR